MFTAIAMFKRHGQEPQVAEKTISLLERGLDQIRHIVSALLVEIKTEPRNLGPQDIDDIAKLVAPRGEKKHLQLDWKYNLENEIQVPAGPVRQVMMNLILNAIQATPEGGHIEVCIDWPADFLTIRITNEGEPISEERLEHLFEPFTESSGSGSGLGLWITDQIVRQLHGHIEVLSDNGKMVFQITLPVAMEIAQKSTMTMQQQ